MYTYGGDATLDGRIDIDDYVRIDQGIAANLSGLFRPTPANVGVTQAAFVVGLLPFGVAPEQAVAAGLALQGLQVLPVLFLGAMLTGWRLLKLETELA
jgi:uncharacterized membrane protein YbhN (UPF0104 family)